MEKKPINITPQTLKKDQDLRDSALTFYCNHVISELKLFYPDEYEMLEMLACGNTKDFIELSYYQDNIKHLIDYGLIKYDNNNFPYIAIPVVGRFIGLDLAKREGRQTIYKVIKKKDRYVWLEQRKDQIINDFRILEKLVQKNNLSLIFGPNSFPEADEFYKIKVVNNKENFVTFINICNRCFVESIENYGNSINDNKYFWNVIKNEYSGLFFSLHRIKIYRHEIDHIALNDAVNKELLKYLENDLEGKKISDVIDVYFVLQQRILDSILSGIQIEYNRLS